MDGLRADTQRTTAEPSDSMSGHRNHEGGRAVCQVGSSRTSQVRKMSLHRRLPQKRQTLCEGYYARGSSPRILCGKVRTVRATKTAMTQIEVYQPHYKVARRLGRETKLEVKVHIYCMSPDGCDFKHKHVDAFGQPIHGYRVVQECTKKSYCPLRVPIRF